MRAIFFLLILLKADILHSQALGGSTAFNFLKLPAGTQQSALGGTNVSGISNDLSMITANPALLRQSMNGQVAANFNLMYGGIRSYHVEGGFSPAKNLTNFALGVHFVDYGEIQETDAGGNVLGTLRPTDYVISVSASRPYEEKWHYGFAGKYIHSAYGQYSSSAFALDAGVNYFDSSRLFQVGLSFMNMGAQIKEYVPGQVEELPFDIQVGITKKLMKAPIQFSFTAHHLHRFNLDYNDESGSGDLGQNSNKASRAGMLLQHLIMAVQFYPGELLELTVGYNHLRRTELTISNGPGGLAGFSMGIGLLLKNMQIRYARSSYQGWTGYNQIGLNVSFL